MSAKNLEDQFTCVEVTPTMRKWTLQHSEMKHWSKCNYCSIISVKFNEQKVKISILFK